MIDTKELRLGNLVNRPLYEDHEVNGITQVEVVLIDGINLSHGDFTLYKSEDIDGIPLTEELLEQCGFKGGKTDIFHNELGNIDIEKHNEDEYILSINYGEYTEGQPFKYLHQLQNLYFALTGKELTLSPIPSTAH